MDNLVYEDDPWAYLHLPFSDYIRTVWPKRYPLGIYIQPVVNAIFIAGVLLACTQVKQEAVFFSILGVTLLFTAAAIVAFHPTKYQIFNERIRIVRWFALHFDIPFSNIDNVTASTWQDLSGLKLNFINSFSSDDIMQIIRKRGAKVHITPSNRDLFLENLNKAVNDWKRGAAKVGS